jgi:uncharacterized protein
MMIEIKKIFSYIMYSKWEPFLDILRTVDINATDEYLRTSVHIAAVNKNPKYLISLLEKGGNPNKQDENMNTPLHYAAELSLTENVKILLENKAIVNTQNTHGNPPLWAAVYDSGGSIETINILLEYGADPNIKNKAGKSSLDFARDIGFPQVVELLEKYAT